jgi:hypothetical protein
MSNDPAARTSPVQGQEASLGCGTLILIALIVMIFSKGGSRDSEAHREVMEKLNAIEKRLVTLEDAAVRRGS